MSPFEEAQAFPRGRRILLIPVALVFLIGPYGAMLGGGPSDPIIWTLTTISIAVCAAILGLGLAPPRRRVVADGTARTIRISSTPPPPHFAQVHEHRAFDDVTSVEIQEFGTAKTATHGYRVVVGFRDDPALHLRLHRDRESAQRTVDHLVLLGLPGISRAAERAAQLDAPKPATWL